ncbi:MAG TPA: DinB family protein [Bryobacteraceae bacterium]|nr:DinB family protein [Bryobacteraceae bacterium]
MAQLTAEDRAFLTAQLNKSRDIVLKEIAGLRPDQWAFRPDEETWSIGECADHILTVERRLFSLVSKAMQSAPADPARAVEVQHKTSKMLHAVPAREVRVKVPPGVVNHSHSASPEEFIGPFEQQRAVVLKYVADTQDPLHDRVSPHMVFNDLDGCQWLLMIALHSQRHADQMAEVKRHAAYPK